MRNLLFFISIFFPHFFQPSFQSCHSFFCVPECLRNSICVPDKKKTITSLSVLAKQASTYPRFSADVDGQFQVEHLNIAFVVASPSAAFTTLAGGAFEVAVFGCQGAVFNEERNNPCDSGRLSAPE